MPDLLLSATRYIQRIKIIKNIIYVTITVLPAGHTIWTTTKASWIIFNLRRDTTVTTETFRNR